MSDLAINLLIAITVVLLSWALAFLVWLTLHIFGVV